MIDEKREERRRFKWDTFDKASLSLAPWLTWQLRGDAGLAGVLAAGVRLRHLETVQGLAVRLYQPDHSSAVSYLFIFFNPYKNLMNSLDLWEEITEITQLQDSQVIW